MNRVSVCVLFIIIVATIPACSFAKKASSSETNSSAQNTNTQAPAKANTVQYQAQPGELQPGQASGTYTAKGETVELKYAYAGRAQRFGSETLVILLTDKPIPPEALAEELKSTPLLEGEKVRGLEYSIEETGMWVRYHPSQYQESGTMKIKDYRVENDTVRGTDENDGSLSDGRYARSVKFVASIVK
ncbi:MAG TPA: hypothetical protein VLA93_05550 [Pyrinomonadaceae bacterium]|nr:hypothetical protein [Pyrinomonadaceae bacterium]